MLSPTAAHLVLLSAALLPRAACDAHNAPRQATTWLNTGSGVQEAASSQTKGVDPHIPEPGFFDKPKLLVPAPKILEPSPTPIAAGGDTGMFRYHKPLLPMDAMDHFAFLLSGVGLIIAAGSGIGGGGILVPMFMFILRFRPKHAIALANFTVLGSSLVQTWANVQKRRPDGRPLVDWSIIVMMEPSTILGVFVGALMAKSMPDFIITACLANVLALLSLRTLQKGIAMFRRESFEADSGEYAGEDAYLEEFVEDDDDGLAAAEGGAVATEPADDTDDEFVEVSHAFPNVDTHHIGTDDEGGEALLGSSLEGGASSSQSARIARPRDVTEESEQLLDGSAGGPPLRHVAALPMPRGAGGGRDGAGGGGQRRKRGSTPWGKIVALSGCFGGCIVLTALRGGVECGSPLFWCLSVAIVPWLLFFGVYFRRQVIRESMGQAGHRVTVSDVVWDSTTTIRYPMLCSIAGVFAGLFGLGGGIVKGPLMLEMGVSPDVSAATVPTMILFTTAAACVSFQAFGLLEADYGLVGFLLGLISTAIGQAGANAWMKASKRQSPPVLLIGGIMALSTALLALEALNEIFTEDSGTLFGPVSVCSATE